MCVGLAVRLRGRGPRTGRVHLSQGVRRRFGVFRAEPDVRLFVVRSGPANLRQRLLLRLRVTPTGNAGPAPDARVLEREHARLFPSGFTLRIGRPPPAAFSVLPADIRQAIWREAIRRVTGKRRRGPSASASSSWQVTALAPEGRLTHVFVAPRRPGVGGASETDPDQRAWALVLQAATWAVPPAATR